MSLDGSRTSLSSGLSDYSSIPTGRRKRVVNKFRFDLSNISGNVAVGTRSARVKIDHAQETDGYDQPSVVNANEEKIAEANEYQDGGYVPGTYCQNTYYRSRSIETREKWDPVPYKAVLIKKGDDEFNTTQYSIETFLENPERFIKEMDVSAGLCKEQREQFILLQLLPHLEESFGKCTSSNEEVFKVLARISCSTNSGKVVKHALQQLFHLICKDFGTTSNHNLLVVEAIIRSSIFSTNGIFKTDEHAEQEIKLFAYSRILSLLLIQQIRREDLPTSALKEHLRKAQEELRKLKNSKKDVSRYSMEFVQAAIPILLKPQNKSSKLRIFLNECHTFCETPNLEISELKILRSLAENNKSLPIIRRNEWIDLHCILIHLHGKVQGERPVPHMETERRAMELIRFIVEAYLQGGGGNDWRFCLLVSSIFVDIAKNNVTKAVREKAGDSLVKLLKDAKVQKKPECRAIVERRSSEVLFCPDSRTRKDLTDFLFRNQNLEDVLPTDLQTEHLTSTYRIQTLEIKSISVHETSASFVNYGMFQRRKVAVKVLKIKRQYLLREDTEFEARERLIREAYNMRRLNADQHRNFPVLLGVDTKNMPYHLITEFEKWGDLLQFLRLSRERDLNLKPTRLVKMLIDISCALQFLQELGLVHRSVMAANVLVGDNYVCKLSGLDFLQQPTNGPPPNVSGKKAKVRFDFEARESDELTLKLDDIVDVLGEVEPGWWEGQLGNKIGEFPSNFVEIIDENDVGQGNNTPAETQVAGLNEHVYEEVKTDRFEGLRVRWQAPECLKYGYFSAASDVWAFGVLTYEVLTYGCIPYRNVKDDDEVASRVVDHKEIVAWEQCFEDREYELIKQCCQWQFYQRPGIGEVNKTLNELLEHAGDKRPRLALPPPPLKVQQLPECSSTELQEPRKLFNSVLDIFKEFSSGSLGEVHNTPYCKTVEDSTVVCERICHGNIQHLRKLLGLKAPNLVSVLKIDRLDPHSQTFEIITPVYPLGNLKEYVLDRKCKQEHIVMFLSQVASALHYLHVNHIVHGDLRAEYVNVESPYTVQVARLGRTKFLSRSANEDTSKKCVVQADIPPHSSRWSAPEVNSDGYYTHASDVWAFGILAWELYKSFASGQENRDFSSPYHGLQTQDEILLAMRAGQTLNQPAGCPNWVYIVMHQCWTYDSTQRPPILAIFDCLTSRKPMNSWIMQLWLQIHDKSKWPDLRVSQSEDAFHVIDTPLHPPKDDIVAMCSEDFFAKHSYEYEEVYGTPLKSSSLSHEYDLVYGTPPISSSQSAGNEKCRKEMASAVVSVPSGDADDCVEELYEDADSVNWQMHFNQQKEQPDAGNKVDDENSSLCEYQDVIRETRV